MNIKENATKGIISTVVGSFIVVAAVISVYIPELNIDWADATIGIGTGLALIGFVKK